MCGEGISVTANHPGGRGGRHVPPFVTFAYELGRSRATGVLASEASGDLLIRHGAAVAAPLDVLGRRAAGELARVATLDSPAWSFRPGPVSAGGRTLPLVQWVRQHVERGVDLALATQLTSELGSTRVSLRPGEAPDLAELDATDRLLVSALAVPRDLRELAALARAPRFRVLAFVHFLRSVGALTTLGAVTESPLPQARRPPPAAPNISLPRSHRAAALQLLGLPAHADTRHVKAAFRALARMLHPDLHPGVGEQRRRELERRLATVNAAYAELTAT